MYAGPDSDVAISSLKMTDIVTVFGDWEVVNSAGISRIRIDGYDNGWISVR